MSVPKGDFIDVGSSHPFVLLEHVNINTGPWNKEFADFYFNALGFVPDPRAEVALANTLAAGGTTEGLVWANLGLQQLHLPSDAPQRVLGHIGLEYSSLAEVEKRLHAANIIHTSVKNKDGSARYIETACPVGNIFKIRQQQPPLSDKSETQINDATEESAVGSYLGPAPYIEPCAVNALPGGLSAGLGMAYVDMTVPPNTATQISVFYNHIFGATATVTQCEETGTRMCEVDVGSRQRIRYTEVRPLTPTHTDNNNTHNAKVHDAYHIAVYVNDFVDIFTRLKALNLVYENPRFPQFTYRTLEEVLHHKEFRLRDIVDLNTGQVVYQLEHEIRSLAHPSFSCKWLLK